MSNFVIFRFFVNLAQFVWAEAERSHFLFTFSVPLKILWIAAVCSWLKSPGMLRCFPYGKISQRYQFLMLWRLLLLLLAVPQLESGET